MDALEKLILRFECQFLLFYFRALFSQNDENILNIFYDSTEFTDYTNFNIIHPII